MGIARGPAHKISGVSLSQAQPVWLERAAALPKRRSVTEAENTLVNLVRLNGELTKSELVGYSDFSLMKITSH
jgi:hypothetical protein